MKRVKCNGCGYIGNEDEFRKSPDFFQQPFISGCPKCNNSQSPGDASMRMFGGDRPFEYVRAEGPKGDPIGEVFHDASEAS